MKAKVIAVLAFTAMFSLSAHAWAGLHISQTRLEFGNLKEGVNAEKVLTLTNTGRDPLKISNVTTS